MSVHYTFLYADRACVLSDRGVWDDQGNLVGTCQKAWVSPNLPFAVFMQGKPVEKLVQVIADMDAWIDKHCDRLGRDRVLASLPAIETYFQDLGRREGKIDAQFLFVGFSKAAGPQQWIVCCHDMHKTQGIAAFSLVNPGRELQSGPPVTLPDLAGEGIEQRDVLKSEFPEKYGAQFISIARRKQLTVPGESSPRFVVGGGCDLTTITAEGVAVKTLCRWNDEIGEPIDASLPAIFPAEAAV